jgi:hypothetical protein
MTNRREFIVQLSLGTGVLASSQAFAQAPALAETDPAAVAQGYKADSTKVDAKKFPKHAATQTCGNCALYQGKAGAASGPCALFPGKDVSAKGWCQAWAKKA